MLLQNAHKLDESERLSRLLRLQLISLIVFMLVALSLFAAHAHDAHTGITVSAPAGGSFVSFPAMEQLVQ